MGRNEKILLWSLALLVGLAAMVGVITSGGFAAPKEHGWIYEWQTLIAGCLALIGAAGVLWAAKWQVNVADREVRQRRRAARMLLASQLEAMAEACDTVVWDLDTPLDGGIVMDVRRSPVIPPPPFAETFPEFGILPPSESEELLRMARTVTKANELAAFKFEQEGVDQAKEVIRPVAAELAIEAFKWNERFSRNVGWEPMVFDRGRIRALKKIVDEDRSKHERER